MASSLLQIGSVTGLTESTAGLSSSPVLDTGDLRRRYNFGDRVSELAIAQDPFFRLVSKVNKKPTDDPQFKFTERRPSYHKRYAYVMGFVSDAADEFGDAELDQFGTAAAVSAVGQTVKLYMVTDYKSAGNIGNVYGNTSTKVDVGATGTAPEFFLPGQLVKIPVTSTAGGGAALASTATVGYHIIKVTAVAAKATKDSKEAVAITGDVVKFESGKNELASFTGNNFSPGGAAGDEAVSDRSIATQLEFMRSYVIGNAHAQGSTYPQTWQDNPFSTGNGLTQIWKTALSMDNTTRATVLKYEGNEFARLWREKLIEHKFDIETAMIFGSQYTDGSGVQYTQGALDYVVNYGNIFSWDTNKSQDDFLDDMSNFLDPRYNNANATVFFCSTDVYNWLHKLSGYFSANMKKTDLGSTNSFGARADMSMGERKSAFGVDVTTVYTPYGVMNVARNVHLDGTNVKILGINMANCAYRPLVGNGINRDTAIYVGVQTLENSGIDKRIDLVQTEAGMEWQMPESHAVWTAS